VKRTTAPAFEALERDWHLSPIVDAGEYVFFSGVTGYRPDGTVDPDPERQFRDAFAFVEANLAEVGLGWGDVVEMTTYHIDLRRHLAAFVRAKDAAIAPPYPAWTAIGVSELITEGTLAEIRIIASRREHGVTEEALPPEELTSENTA
jgi:enamine deaminase RidA (YjgF/YER057c/UK114 family)